MTDTNVVLPKALEGVDLKRFTAEKLTVDPNKSFEENLNDLFGITGKQAAEIVAAALAMNAPIGTPAPIKALPTGGRRKLKGGVGVFGVLAAAAAALLGTTSHAATSIASVEVMARNAPTDSQLYTTAAKWHAVATKTCAPVYTYPALTNVGGPTESYSITTSTAPVGTAPKNTGVTAVEDSLCAISKYRYDNAVNDLANRPDLQDSFTASPLQTTWGEANTTPKNANAKPYVGDNAGRLVAKEVKALEDAGILQNGVVVDHNAFIGNLTAHAESWGSPQANLIHPVGGKRRSKTKKRRVYRRRRTYRN
jgi:hypothetical protein